MPFTPPSPWRLYTEADAEQVARHHAEQEQAIGRKMDLPDLYDRPILVALVREIDGKITNVVYVEAEAEVCGLGQGAIPAEEWESVTESLAELLSARGIRIVRAFVPEKFLSVTKNGKRKAGPVSRLLKRAGFTRESESMVQFFRWLI